MMGSWLSSNRHTSVHSNQNQTQHCAVMENIGQTSAWKHMTGCCAGDHLSHHQVISLDFRHEQHLQHNWQQGFAMCWCL